MYFKQGSRILAYLLPLAFLNSGLSEAGSLSGEWEAVAQSFAVAMKAEQKNKDIPAMSAVLVHDGKVIWLGGAGSEDAEGRMPSSGQSIYRLGAVSELFTDILMLQLAEKGQLDLDAPVQTYLPSFAPDRTTETPVTLQLLMKHQTGATAGGQFSPAAASVLGSVIEKVTGKSYQNVIQSDIFQCLGMSDSGVPGDRLPRPFVDGWFTSYDDGKVIAPRHDVDDLAAEGIYSSARDLGRLVQALTGEGEDEGCRLLGPKGREILWALPSWNNLFTPGFYRRQVSGYGSISYSGSVLGHTAEITLDPVSKTGVAILGNSHMTPVVRRLAQYAEALMRAAGNNEALPVYLVTEEIAEEVRRKVSGYYQHEGESLMLRSLWDKLYLEASSVTSEVRQENGKWYLDDTRNFSADIEVDPEGKWVRLGGLVYQRAVWHKPKAPAPELAGLIGEYGVQGDYIRIYERDGRAYARLEWLNYEQLVQVDDVTWQLTEDGLYPREKLAFTRNPAGQGAEVMFRGKIYKRRDFGAEVEEKIRAGVRVNDTLRVNALKASPPREEGDFRVPDLVELTRVDPRLKLDIRYAGDNNFIGMPVYLEARAFLQRPAASALQQAHDWLRERGYGLLIHDGYRPWFVTKIFWDATPEDSKIYVANPANGSRHNRGAAVDLTLYDLETGDVVTMPGRYDELWIRSAPNYVGGSDLERWHKDLLRQAMETHDFIIYPWEWWHFDYIDWQKYPIQDKAFSEISSD